MMALAMAIGLSSVAIAAEVEVLRDGFDGATAGRLAGTTTFVEGRDDEALKLDGQASAIYDDPEFPREAGRIEVDICLHAKIEPRQDGKQWMLLTDVGASSAWRGATVIYWDRETADLRYGVYDGGWHWLTAEGVSWPVGEWRHLTFTYGPRGRTLEIEGDVVAQDDYADGLAPRGMHLGYVDGYSVAAPVLVDNFVVTAELVDALRVDRAVVCSRPDGLLDTVTIQWTAAEPARAALDLRTAVGEVVAPILAAKQVDPGMYTTVFAGADAASGDYEIRLTLERPEARVKVLRAALSVEGYLHFEPALNRMGEVFPIGVWYFWEQDSSHNGTHVDDEKAARDYYESTMADLARLGINTVMGCWTPRDHRTLLLDAAERHGIRVIVHLDEVNSLLWLPERLGKENFVPVFREAVDTARDHPATLGYYLVDEPSPTQENIANIKMARQLLQAIDPEHPGFSCLNTGWGETFPQVGYHVLLVDIYPVYSARLQGEVLDGYIAALDRASAVAGDSPLWVIPQCFGFGGPNPHGIPEPHEVSLMVWEAIAHGAKGIIYFIYQSTTGIQGEWLRGIVDERLQPMDHRYSEVRHLNSAIAALTDTLLQLRRIPNRGASAQEGIDVQAFAHADGTRYVCVVNQATGAAVDADLRFEPAQAEQITDVVDVATGERVGDGGGASVPLGPGEGKLLRIASP